ncbi:CDPK-related kinase 1 [Euphorbia peplus]|nr:CDPK-related kinase 1 [Euphorbia peplus]
MLLIHASRDTDSENPPNSDEFSSTAELRLCKGGELLNSIHMRVENTQRKKQRLIMVQISSVAAYCHVQGVVYRVLKLEVVMETCLCVWLLSHEPAIEYHHLVTGAERMDQTSSLLTRMIKVLHTRYKSMVDAATNINCLGYTSCH